MYSPAIAPGLIPVLYRLGKARGVPMPTLAQQPNEPKQEIPVIQAKEPKPVIQMKKQGPAHLLHPNAGLPQRVPSPRCTARSPETLGGIGVPVLGI